MAKTFLEQARDIEQTIKNSGGMKHGLALEEEGLLFYNCWPEILAVIEAAQDVQPDRSTIEETVNDLIGAVDALDRKAGEKNGR